MVNDSPTGNLETIAEKVRAALARRYEARERALALSRMVIRHAANTIRAVHRRELEAAHGLLATSGGLLAKLEEALQEHPELRYTGYVEDAQKEYAEAAITMALVSGRPLADPEELGVSYAAYLNGMGEAVGEMRRHLLDALRRNEVSHCEQILSAMDDIYNVLVTMDFPDALTGGLRRTTDMVRGVLERTRGDLTLAIVQDAWERELRRLSVGPPESS